ncbi:uncharacterized protein LOC114518129 [Dendronephthya gigantea]|uniref:uncharacterized protein LOC114518129 n=1 Tax=Dendronephthya gigantea TaxID=151771 RepID=UPI00106D297C|nr:uncharacterized protein LOC114518129 [Dendronephthya gigantea]
MSTSVSKSRSPVERSYSSASSTTSSRRSGRRKRRRMKHTVMPLKKRPERNAVACDVHRVSNLDHEAMEQSSCFWVAKNVDNPSERSFKEDVFVNKDQDSSDEEMSYLDESRRSQTSGEFAHEFRTDTHETRTETHERFNEYNTDEKENNAKYANEKERTDGKYDEEKNDANYSEEKTFYGVRKGRVKDGNDVERVSSVSSPRNRSRVSSYSDDGQSGFSSEGTGMHVGWTSDVGVSSEQEYSVMTDEESEGGHKRTRRNSKEFYGYRKKDGERVEEEFPARKIRERKSNEENVVIATDVTVTKTTEAENFADNETGDLYETDKYKENAQIDREFYTKEEIEGSRYSEYNSSGVRPGLNARGDFESRYSETPRYKSPEQVDVGDFEPPINDQGEFVSRQYEPSGQNNRRTGGRFPPGKTSTPTGHVYPSSDTELVNFRSFDIDIEQQSDRSLPLGGHKTKTQYYSVEDLIRAAKEEEENLEKADSGSDGPEVPRGYGEYEKYEPPRETRMVDEPVHGSHEDHPDSGSQGDGPASDQPREEPRPNGMDYETSRVIPTSYDVKSQRPLLVSRREKDTDGQEKEDPRDGTVEGNVHSGRYGDSREFYGYRRAEVGNEYEDNNKETLGGEQYGKENDSNRPTEDNKVGSQNGKDVESDDEGEFEESKEFYGYRKPPKHEAEPQDDARQQYDEKKSSSHQSEDRKYEQTNEFYGYRTTKAGGQFPREGIPQYGQKRDNARPPNGDWGQNQEFYGYRQSETSNGFVRPEHEQQQTSDNTTTTHTFKESKQFYGYRTFGSSENISKKGRGGREGQTESREFYGYRTFGSSENISKGRGGREGQIESKEFYGYRTFGSSENVSRDPRGVRDGQIWEESKEFFGFRRRQVVDGQTHFAVSGHQDRPSSPFQRKMEGKPLYLESADHKNQSLETGSYEKRPYENETYDKRPPSNEQPYEGHPYAKQSPFEERPYEKQGTRNNHLRRSALMNV